MTPDQLRAASHGDAPKVSTGSDVMARAYSMGKFKFSVVIDYKPRSDDPGNNDPKNLVLDAVLLNLDLTSGKCAELKTYLKNVYGNPDRTFASGPAGFLWNDKKLGDDINYYSFDERNGCTVMYMPLGSHDR